MAKAKLVLPDGTTVDIDGTAEEVAKLLATFSGASAVGPAKKRERKGKSGGAKKASGGAGATRRKGPQALIAELAEAGYFKSKRTIGDIQKKLEEGGHIYAQTSLSTPLLRLTRGKTLRRLKEKGSWVYVS